MKEEQGSDELLMQRVARGERAAMSLLLRRHAAPLLTFLRRVNADRQRSEDVFQETFLAVWVARESYNFPRSFRAWLYGIAINKCREELRRRSWRPDPWPVASEDGISTYSPSPAETAIATETADLVRSALLRLPARQREVVVLRVYNGLSYAEIAAALGCDEGTVRSNMFRGLEAIRKHLEPRLR